MLHLYQQEKLFYNDIEAAKCDEQKIMSVANDNCLMRPYDNPHDLMQSESQPKYNVIYPCETMPMPGPSFQHHLGGHQSQPYEPCLAPGLGSGYPYHNPHQPPRYVGHQSQLDLKEPTSRPDLQKPLYHPDLQRPLSHIDMERLPYKYERESQPQYNMIYPSETMPMPGPSFHPEGHQGPPYRPYLAPGLGSGYPYNNPHQPPQYVGHQSQLDLQESTSIPYLQRPLSNPDMERLPVAERVLSRMPLLFEKKRIDVEIFIPRSPTPDVEGDRQASGNEDTGDMPTEFVIEVTGMKPTTSGDTIRFYFESRKVANADVVKMEFIEEKEMYLIWFEEESAIEAVMSKTHRVDGQTLNVERYVQPSPAKYVPTYEDKVFITNISLTTTKEGLENFLEFKSKCIPEEIIFGEAEGTALVTFEQPPDMEKLQTACMKRQLDGSHLNIDPVPITDCIVVTGYKDNTLSDTMEYYFNTKRRSGVEGVREVKLVQDEGKFLVYFTDPDSALQVCNREHKVEGQVLKVQVYYECLRLVKMDQN
ncbi:uncharacterized protein LOC127735527 isoform X3 [Mytilus californianus]|uniref:uncharacterized protein LOC127735527 isoform X3 n=1 Tax=Mytilus californianus TaxID=6549 RepID=UPI002248470E|nr:uncharacterized protein LOC127735527 isoform X3 [Mytilus californianus]